MRRGALCAITTRLNDRHASLHTPGELTPPGDALRGALP